MKQNNPTTIHCPNCGTEIDVNAVLYHQLEEELSGKYARELQEEKERLSAELKAFNNKKQQLESRERSLEMEVAKKLREKLEAEKAAVEAHVRKQMEMEVEGRLSQLQRELSEKSKQVQQLNASRAEVERLKREKEELARSIEAQAEAKLSEALKAEREKIAAQLTEQIEQRHKAQEELLRAELNEKDDALKQLQRTRLEVEKLKREKEQIALDAELKAQAALSEQLVKERERLQKQIEQQSELKLKEKDKQLADLHHQLEEARRKAEQGSMQLQGEVQELAIESWLADHFPFDTIDEIKKGARGADCLQIVNTREMPNCGTIYYESKRTKEFSNSWIEKFKADIRDKGADIGVLVTEVLPKGMERMGLYDGIWICTYEEFKGLSAVLRETIVDLARISRMQENRHDKMSLLYDYLTSNEFRLQIEAIVEGFTKMREGLDREKRAMTKIWKEREKQIDKVLDSTIGMYGSVRGIAGSAVQQIEILELEQ